MTKSKTNVVIGTVDLITNNQVSETSDCYRLLYLNKGSGRIQINNDVFNAGSEAVIIVNPSEKLKISLSLGFELIVINLPKSNVVRYSEFDDVFFQCNSITSTNWQYDELQKVIKRIYRLSLDPDSYLVLNAQLLVLLNDLLVNYMDNSILKADEKSEHQKYFRRNMKIKDFIEENYNKDISLSDLAEELDLSLSYTSRFFNEQFGLSFTDYLNGIRILNAADDLIYTNLTVIKIAMLNGFANVSRFNSVFKAKYGVTPSAYREKQRKEVITYSDDKNDFSNLHVKHSSTVEKRLNKYVSDEVIVTKEYDIDINTKPTINNEKFRLIMNFGWVEEISDGDTFNTNIEKSALYGYKYVRLKCTKESFQGAPQKHLFSLIDTILSFQLIPFLAIDCKDLGTENMRKIISDLVNRYGISLVREWYFELINISGPKLDSTLLMMLNILHKSKIGVGLGNNIDIKELSNVIKPLINLHIGFVSLGYYFEGQNNDKKESKEWMNLYFNQLSKTINSENTHIQVIISEWGFSQENTIVHDSLYYGAFILDFIFASISRDFICGYSLINDEYINNDSNEIFFGGSGLMNINQIEKPSGHAYIFLKKLGKEVIFSNRNILVTRRNDYEYLIIGHNVHDLNEYYYRNKDRLNREDRDLIFNSESILKANLNLTNLPYGEYKLKTYTLDSDHGDVINIWNQLENISDLRSDEFAYLSAKSLPRLTIKMVKNTNILSIPLELNKNQFFMTYIYRIL